MGGILIALTEYNPIRGILGSEWVGFEHFTRFLSSPDFMEYLMNTLKLSAYGLLWGFPAPIILAFLLNRILSDKTKQNIQLVLYMPNLTAVFEKYPEYKARVGKFQKHFLHSSSSQTAVLSTDGAPCFPYHRRCRLDQ